ncbi:O-acyltransferase like protein-like [Limulus polyphemus]|uniref:O-acyltransferase like protein-like n=1 Tax=Limulus polyphemus TaxID=6850 RepID=A0ABM1SUA3_LIMPO|nr:O-acyltransferase like protein-like [Limulus polyphemus]
MGKPPSGIFKGNFMWIGSYKECVDVEVPQVAVNVSDISHVFGDFSGQYCLSNWGLQFSKAVSIPVTVGLCLPSSCKNDAIQKEVSTLWKIIGSSSSLKRKMKSVSLSSVTCKSHSIPWKAADIVALVLYSFMGALLVVGTSYDVIIKLIFEKTKQKQYSTDEPGQADSLVKCSEPTPDHSGSENNSSVPHPVDLSNPECDNTTNTLYAESEGSISKQAAALDSNQHQIVVPCTEKLISKETLYSPGIIGKILLCFSVYANGAKILDATPPKGHLGCVHGIRFLSMTWVILGHTYAFGYPFFENTLEGLKLVDKWTFQVILQGTFSVDTFFLLSGLLITYLYLKEINKGGKINWIYFYVHRFWRLTPPFMLLLAFDAVLWKHLGSGPYWPEEGMEGTKCSKYWWRNLLYINNMWNATEMCMGWTWYLANDMQFYIISPLFLAFFNSHSIISLIIVGALMITCWTSTGVLSSIHEITAAIQLDKDADPNVAQRM